MKKIIYNFAIILLLVGCVDLEEDPKAGIFADGFFDSEQSVDEATAGLYKRIINGSNPWETALSSTRFRAAFCGADDYTSKTGSNKQNWVDADIFAFRTTPLSGTMGVNAYDVPWGGILQANWIVNEASAYAESLSAQEMARVNSRIAEARFWRAWCYFYLVRMFGPMPISATEVYNPETDLNQRSEQVESIYNFIENDLRWAIDNALPAIAGVKQSRVSKEAAEAFMAEFALTRAGWPLKQLNYYDTAEVYAERVINSGKYTLFNDFYDLFDPVNEDNSEYIWQLNFCLGAVCDGNGGSVFSQKGSKPVEIGGGFSDLFLEKNFSDNFPEGPRKVRSMVSTYKKVVDGDTVDLPFSVDRAYMSKFWGNSYDSTRLGSELPSTDFSDLDWPMIRLAEVYMIYAEAQAMSDGAPNAQSIDYVNQIKRRGAGLDMNTPATSVDLPSGLSAIDFQEAILEERGWEFLGEMQRWFDLTRLEKVAEVTENRDAEDLPLTNAAPIPGDGLSIGDPYYFLKPVQDAEQNPRINEVNPEVLDF